jgi:ABC-2 type transport system ATP-binding protein
MERNLPLALELANLEKSFGVVKAVRDVSFKINPGEIYALIGPNGAGKTTIVKMVTGLIEPNSGIVQVLGINAWVDPIHAKRLLGYIPDEPFVYNYLSAREFLELTGDLHGISREEIKTRIEELAKLYQLDELLDSAFADFSRGNKQKATIVAAMLHRPKLLVIDEPIVGLDTQSQLVTKKLLTDFAKKGGIVFLCTHTLPVAQEIANRIGILKEGKLIAEGTLAELRYQAGTHHNQLEEIYLKLTRI